MPKYFAGDVQIVLLEMQPAIVASTSTLPVVSLCKATKALKAIADSLGVPILASVVPLGNGDPVLVEELAEIEPLSRTVVSLFDDHEATRRIASAGRNILAIAGVSSEVAVLHTVLDARRAGYDVYVITDCCGGLSDRSEAAAFRQMELAGAVPSNVSSFFTGMIDDMTSDHGLAVMQALARLWSWQTGGDKPLGAADGFPEKDVETLFDELRAAWHEGDAKRFASLFGADARFVAFDGTTLTGPEAIAAFHATPFKTYLANTTLVLNVQQTRILGDDAMIVFSCGGIITDGDAHGDLTGESAQMFVVAVEQGVLRIEAFQNTRIRPIEGPVTAEMWKQFDRAWSAQTSATSNPALEALAISPAS